ncbi:MAG: septum formation protein Maf [Chlorobi bacterium]|nr:septum formation protein Maf [Chlorobiota bacterium]
MMLSDTLKNYKIILASASPRRRHLLGEMGFEFDVVSRKIAEVFPLAYNPEQVALHLAELKAAAFSTTELEPDKLLIAADTVVALENRILGKPISRKNAFDTLEQLSGRSHKVITGVCLRTSTGTHSFASSTKVYFKQLDAEEINYYITNFLPFDKAGAYGIQEWIGHVAIEKIEGSYYNVMGLPTHKLYEELMSFI